MNYLSNQEPRIPTRLKIAISDIVTKHELHAARAALGYNNSPEEALFTELKTIVKRNNPEGYKGVIKK